MNNRYEIVTRNVKTFYVYRLISLLSGDWKKKEEKGLGTLHEMAYFATCISSGLITRDDIKEYACRCNEKAGKYDTVLYTPFTKRLGKFLCERLNLLKSDLIRA